MQYIIHILLIVVIVEVIGVINATSVSKSAVAFSNTINKCCPEGLYVGKRKSCEKYNGTLSFSAVKVYTDDLTYSGRNILDTFHLAANKFENKTFKKASLDITLLDFNIYLSENGILNLELPNAYHRWRLIEPRHYCVDYRITKDPSKIVPRFWVILPGESFTPSNIYFTSGTLISCFFMLLVLIVYFLLPELQNLCGMILMAYVASLFMGFLLLAIIQIKIHTTDACIGLTCGIYYFFLAAFCWMSIMSYDIWWTFRGYAKARPIHRRGERFKFLMYCLYAWGLPLLMTIGLAVLNTMSSSMRHLPWFITPHVPDFGCFLEGGEKLVYLYAPMLILILCNWIFYLMTAFNIWRLSRGTSVLDSAAAGTPQAHRTHRHRLMVYLKLSVVMGLNWLLEIVSFVYPGFKMWYITDAYNILIGFAIFLIFICKKKIFRKLCIRYLGKNKLGWYPSSKSYSSSISDSTHETATLQSKVSSQPSGLNGYILAPTGKKSDF